jgi:predicted RecA/RadA family phage recombinase
MKTKISDANVIDFTAPSGGTTSGVGVLIGSFFAIAVTTNVAGDTVAGHTSGVFDHAKEGAGSGQAWAFGDTVYWDNTNKRLTKTSSGNTKVGYATAAALTTDTVGRFRLVPFAA